MFQSVIVYSSSKDSLVAELFSDWLKVQMGIEQVVVDELSRITNLMNTEQLCIVIRDKEIADDVVARIKELRSKGVNNKVLIIDNVGFSIIEIRTVLSLKYCGIHSANTSSKALVANILEFYTKDWVLEAGILDQVLQSLITVELNQKHTSGFSKYEEQILMAAKEGLSIKETAVRLGLSANTIAVYRSKMLRKAGLSSFHQMVVEAKKVV